MCTLFSCTVYVSLISFRFKNRMQQRSPEDQNQFTQFANACALVHWLQEHGLKIFLKVSKCLLMSHPLYIHRVNVLKYLQGQNRIWLGIWTKSTFKILPFNKIYIFNATLRWELFKKKVKTKQHSGSPRRHVLSYLPQLNNIPELHTSLLILPKAQLHAQQMQRNQATLVPVTLRHRRQAQLV